MKIFYLLLFSFLLSLPVNSEEVFCLKKSSSVQTQSCNITFSHSTTIKPFNSKSVIYGLSISGYLIKKSPNYVARVILTDTNGKEYLIMEAYEEINSDSLISFSNYCEETSILESVTPDSIKIFLKDATLHISNFFIAHDHYVGDNEKRKLRRSQTRSIIDKINTYNRSHKRLWIAGETEISQLDYSKRKLALGISDSVSTGGIEYYIGGIFEYEHTVSTLSRQSGSDYVDSFNWRNRHGKNWITSVKDQGITNFCTVFAGVGVLEAMANLFYNQKLNFNLSEQEIVDCADIYPHYAGSGFSLGTVLNYISSHGICLESDYPQDFCYEPSVTINCKSDSITINELVRANGDNMVQTNSDAIKSALISKGPMLSGWNPGDGSTGHAMVLVGYGTLHVGDSVFYYNPNNNIKTFIASISETDTEMIGATYWIFKNSIGTGHLHQEDGFISIIFPEQTISNNYSYLKGIIPPCYLKTPISTLAMTEDNIAIIDEDGDGYYSWGIGPKPASCPEWIPNSPDGDDSNPTIHYMDSYGKFPQVDTFPRGREILLSDRLISCNETLTSDIEINHGVTLKITGSAYCMENVKITNYGGTIIIDGGVLANANIELIPPCSLIIKNGGCLYMKKNIELSIPSGCTFKIEEGEVRQPYKRLF